jgi:catechol 2,3-dioxygenase-like lactoylglutathione lyase family enzyme
MDDYFQRRQGGDGMTDHVKWTLSSLLILVSDLDRSLKFYMDVCDLPEIMREADAALLGDDVPGSLTLDLRRADRGAARAGQQSLGLRACSFYVGSNVELNRIEGRLKGLSAFQDRRQLGEGGGIGLVRGHDPDRLPLAFVSYERPLTGAEHRDALSLTYGWDV